MAFQLDDYIVDRVQYATAEDSTGRLLYVLTQLSDASINTTAQSTDANDAQGTLVKRFWKSKSVEFTATNAFFNMSIAGAASGDGKKSVANDLAALKGDEKAFGRILHAKAGEVVDLTNGGANKVVDGTVKVYALGKNGSLGDAMEQDTAASTGKFAYATGKVTMPPVADGAPTQYLIKYDRVPKEAVYTTNRSNKFPKTVHLLVKALGIDPCEPDDLKSLYIDIPSFQVSPEVNITLTTDGNLNYSGQVQQNYCSDDKELYTIYAVAGDDEEADDEE